MIGNYFARGSGGEILWWARPCVCLSVCLSVSEHISGTTRAIFTNVSVHVAYGHGSVLLRQGDEIPRGRGNFGGCPGHSKALAIFAKAVAAASCSRRDHSVCQASANRNAEHSERRQCGISAGKGWWECTARLVGWLEFNVPFQHKYDYIRDETSGVEIKN